MIKIELDIEQLSCLIQSSVRKALDEATRQQIASTNPPDKLLTIHEAGDLLRLTVPTMYSKVSRGELPVMKRGKRLYFSRTELMDYLKEGRKKSNAEVEQEAEAYLLAKEKGVNNG